MQSNLPIQNLLKYSFRTSLGVGCFVLVTGSTVEPSWLSTFFRGATTSLLFFCSCLINIFFLLFLEKKGEEVKSEFVSARFFCGHFGTFLLITLLHSVNSTLVDRGILPPSYYEQTKLYYPSETWLFWLHILAVSFIVFVLVYFFHNFVLLQFEKNRTELEISKLKVANFETANQLLRQQIQPHFLFNALNVLKSLIRKYPVTAEEYLIRLSDFLRASITVSRMDTATLAQELKLCEDYMEMQKIRFGDSIRYRVLIAEDDACIHKFLPFFSLQPLLENAIKHNELTDKKPLEITITREGDWVKVENNIQPKSFVENSTGNGLLNLKERYRILSGDEIVIKMTDEVFSVEVKILEHEYHHNRG